LPEQSFMLFPCTVRVHCRLDRTQGPARHLGLDPCATDRSRRLLIMQILSLVNHLDSSKNRADSLARPGRIALKKCQKTLVHRKPSVKRFECYVWRFAKAFGKAITEKKGHKVASGRRLCGIEVEIEYKPESCFPLKSDAMISPTHDS